MPDNKVTAKQYAEEARAVVMGLQVNAKGDRELLGAIALLTNAVLELAKKE